MSGENLPKFNPKPPKAHIQKRHAIKSAFSLDPQFFIDLREHLEGARNSSNAILQLTLDGLKNSINKSGDLLRIMAMEGSFDPPEIIPSVDQLTRLVQVAFWASLEREEGRPLYFTVNFMSPDPGDETLVAFDNPILYEVRELTKIAPAIGITGAALLVTPFENDQLKIWGIRDRSFAPVRVKVIDPGSVIVKFNDTNIAAISRSEAIHIRDPLLTRSSVIWSRFGRDEKGEKYNQWEDPRINAVLETVKRMRALGHGGALIIVPADGGWRESVQSPITYSGSKLYNPFRHSIPQLRELKKKPGHTWAEEAYLWALTTEVCRMLSRLTSVDGATIVTYDLDLVGFGAKLQPSLDPTKIWRIFNVDPLDHQNWLTRVKLEQLGGTRHQSAARFIIAQKDAIAFVVSQDGDVTAFVWGQPDPQESPALYAHRRLELTLF